MLRSEGDRLTRVVVSTPRNEYVRVTDAGEHNFNERPDSAAAVAQHETLQRTMAEAGADVIDVPELFDHPNSVFTRDVAVVTPAGYVALRMGLSSRRGEEAWLARALDEAGESRAGVIEPPGTVEGGDVMLMGRVAFVGLSARTNQSGVAQLATLLGAMGYEVRVVPVDGYLHLGGAVSAVSPERLLVVRGEYAPKSFDGFDVIEVDRDGPSTGNVICVAPDEVIANVAENQRAIDVLDASDVRVHPVDLSEFRKGAGGPSCLMMPLGREA